MENFFKTVPLGPPYVMDNRLCSGLTPNSAAAMELHAFQNRIRTDAGFRHLINQTMLEMVFQVQSAVPTEPFSDFAVALTDYFMSFLLNNGVLPAVYHITNEVTLEDLPKDFTDIPEIRTELRRVASTANNGTGGWLIEPFASGEYFVFEGSYELTITAVNPDDYVPVKLIINTADYKKNDIHIETVLERVIPAIPELPSL